MTLCVTILGADVVIPIIVMLSIIMLSVADAESQNAKCHFAEFG
jgi:hypothetical protein